MTAYHRPSGARIIFLLLFSAAWMFSAAKHASAQFALLNVGKINTGGSALGVALSGRYCYVANFQNGMRIYDVSDPSHPTYLSQVMPDGNVNAVAVKDNYCYLANGQMGLRIYDVSDPQNPTEVGHTNNG